MDRKELDKTLECHKLWLTNCEGGRRANLRGADLSDADLRGADLRGADLSDANLRGADLRGADLSDANLRGADLRGADLSDADLSDADLSDADLRGADLSDANLRGADLRGADLSDADLSDANLRRADLDFSCLPLWCGGQFKADDKICKQLVAHVVRIMELSEIDNPKLIKYMNEYKSGWHRESEF